MRLSAALSKICFLETTKVVLEEYQMGSGFLQAMNGRFLWLALMCLHGASKSVEVSPNLPLARLAEQRPSFVAAPLAAYQRKRHVDDETLAQRLRGEVPNLVHLRLCRVPRTDSDYFNEDVDRIAKHVHADAVTLAQILREP